MLAPVKLATVNDDTSDSSAVPANPLRGRVDNNVGALNFAQIRMYRFRS